MKDEQVKLDRAHAWQALHMTAAAACRGSTPGGGTGPRGNVVLAKKYTRSCSQVCGATIYNLCYADVSISGYLGRAVLHPATRTLLQLRLWSVDLPARGAECEI